MKQPNVKQLLAKVAALEERIKQLEARPQNVTQYHYHYETPRIVPWWQPPQYQPYVVTCGSNATGTGTITANTTPVTSGYAWVDPNVQISYTSN